MGDKTLLVLQIGDDFALRIDDLRPAVIVEFFRVSALLAVVRESERQSGRSILAKRRARLRRRGAYRRWANRALAHAEEFDLWLESEVSEALKFQRPLPAADRREQRKKDGPVIAA